MILSLLHHSVEFIRLSVRLLMLLHSTSEFDEKQSRRNRVLHKGPNEVGQFKSSTEESPNEQLEEFFFAVS